MPSAAASILAAAVLAASPSPAAFTDITGASGIPPLKYGEGVNFCDFDGDRLPDLFLPVVKGLNRLFLNAGKGTFSDAGEAWGLRESNGIGAVCGDVNGDGHTDLYVVRGANPYGFNLLYLGTGSGGFENVSEESGASAKKNGISAVAADVDGDGDLDLFASNWGADSLYLNEGGAQRVSFSEAAEEAGLGGETRSWSGLFADFSGDGRPDLYVARGGSERGGTSRLFLNRGDGSFRDDTAVSGLESAGWSMGAVPLDFDGDGDLDLFTTSFNAEDRLFRNDGNAVFRDVTAAMGITSTRSVGAAAGDIDGDFLPDLVVAGFAGPVRYLRNTGAGFREVTGAGLQEHGRNEGAALADIDGDGDLDLYVANYDGRNRLYRNNLNSGNYVKIRAAGGSRLPVGTTSSLYRPGAGFRDDAHLARRDLLAGFGFCSQGTLEMLYRLPDEGPYDLRILFPGGRVLALEAIKSGAVEIQYGDGANPTATRP